MSRRYAPILAAIVAASALIISGCQQARRPDAAPPDTSRDSTGGAESALRPPALYTDTFPCPDCDGIAHQLDLRPGGIYFLRTTYLGRSVPVGPGFDELGQWSRTSDSGAITLRHRDASVSFTLGPDGTLRRLDAPGKAAPMPVPELHRAAEYRPLEPRLQIRGLYREGDGGWLTECTTGMVLRVAPEGELEALRAAWSKMRPAGGAPMLADLEGRIVARPAGGSGGSSGGNREEQVLVVDRFAHAYPDTSCAGQGSTPGLEDAYWKLTRLGNRPITTYGEREAFFRLDPGTRKLQGSTGCNRIAGGYEASGTRVHFGEVITTKMACEGLMEQERGFLDALRDAASWKVVDGALELYDAGGKLLARFEQPT